MQEAGGAPAPGPDDGDGPHPEQAALTFIRLLPAPLLEPMFDAAIALLHSTPKRDLPAPVRAFVEWNAAALRKATARQALRSALLADQGWQRLVWIAATEGAEDAPNTAAWRATKALLAGDWTTVAHEWAEHERSAALASRMDGFDDLERELVKVHADLDAARAAHADLRRELDRTRAAQRRPARSDEDKGSTVASAEIDGLRAQAAELETLADSLRTRARDAEAERDRLRQAVASQRAANNALQDALAATRLQAGGAPALRRAAGLLREVAELLDRESGSASAAATAQPAGTQKPEAQRPTRPSAARRRSAGAPGTGLLPAGATTAEPAALRAVLERGGVRCIVDGYNVLLARDDDGSLSTRRDRLLRRLAGLHLGTGAEIHVVFDSRQADGQATVGQTDRGVRVEFTAPHAIADDRIADMAANAAHRPTSVCVVTSDVELRERCERHGVLVFPATTLLGALA